LNIVFLFDPALIMASAAQRAQILRLFRQTLKAAAEFETYNFREYFTRRAHDQFRQIQTEKQASAVESFLTRATSELEVIKRQAKVNKLFALHDSIISTLPPASKPL
jgi:hypothetical protein